MDQKDRQVQLGQPSPSPRNWDSQSAGIKYVQCIGGQFSCEQSNSKISSAFHCFSISFLSNRCIKFVPNCGVHAVSSWMPLCWLRYMSCAFGLLIRVLLCTCARLCVCVPACMPPYAWKCILRAFVVPCELRTQRVCHARSIGVRTTEGD